MALVKSHAGLSEQYWSGSTLTATLWGAFPPRGGTLCTIMQRCSISDIFMV